MFEWGFCIFMHQKPSSDVLFSIDDALKSLECKYNLDMFTAIANLQVKLLHLMSSTLTDFYSSACSSFFFLGGL